jgi:hypothetical protein
MSASCAADADADMVSSKILACKLTALLVEGCREHHVAMIGILVGVYQS